MRRRTFIAAAPVLLVAACTSAPPAPPAIAVFFTADSATLEPEALQVVQAAAQAAKATTGSGVVLGLAGPAGGVAYNVALSEARAQQVAARTFAATQWHALLSATPLSAPPITRLPTNTRMPPIRTSTMMISSRLKPCWERGEWNAVIGRVRDMVADSPGMLS